MTGDDDDGGDYNISWRDVISRLKPPTNSRQSWPWCFQGNFTAHLQEAGGGGTKQGDDKMSGWRSRPPQPHVRVAQQPAQVKYFRGVECFRISRNSPLLPIRPLISFLLFTRVTVAHTPADAGPGRQPSFCRKTSAWTCEPNSPETTCTCTESRAHPKNCLTIYRKSKLTVE